MVGGNRSVAAAILSIWTFLSLLGPSLAQQAVMASNITNDLPQPGSARYILNSSDVGIPKMKLVPLSHSLAFLSAGDFSTISIKGNLLRVVDDPSILRPEDIAYISCDTSSYPGHLTADDTVMSTVTMGNLPNAIILYSIDANHCNYSVPDIVHFDNLFTTVDQMLAFNLQSRLANISQTHPATIVPDPTSMQTSSPSGNSSNGSSNSNSNVLGPSPTTAVAMIILYSITGIITALFLIIIITGAIRAHRHPERYGPRNALGRPRQSRAKGLARAMLETLPIVKFGDNEESKPTAAGENVELGATNGEAGGRKSTERTESTETNTESSQEGATVPVAGAHANDSHEDHALSCSICTEDFKKGQDIRVLPCNHKFHPDCVDPWLLNVSGTCPLCRVDLRPATSHASDAPPATPTSGDLPPPLEEITEAPSPVNTGRQRGSIFFNLRHLRDASAEERIAALRTLHSQSQRAATNASNDTDRERRVSRRLRDVFRIRTRRQGAEASNPAIPEGEPEADPLERRRTGTYAG